MENIYFTSVFAAGVLSFLSPCILPLLPVYFSLFTQDNDDISDHPKRYLILKTLCFVLGISTVFLLLGYGAGKVSAFFLQRQVTQILGIIVIIFGILQTGLIKLPFLEKEYRHLSSAKGNYLSTYLLGLTFSFGWTPCIGPILGGVLGLAASQSLNALPLMGVYTLGFTIPFLILAVLSDVLLHRIKGIYRYFNIIKIIGGVMLIIMGILLFTNSLNVIMRLI